MNGAPTTFAVIGPGRAGQSLLKALEGTNWTCQGIFGRNDDVTKAAASVDALILAVPDDAIAAVARTVEPGRAVVMHVSGAKTLDVLAPHGKRASVHPLVSLPSPEIGRRRLRAGATFAVAGDGVAWRLVQALDGRAIEIDESQRARYHAAAAIASNHLVALCAQVERLAKTVGMPVDRYWDLMDSTLDNVRRSDPISALTGPAARGDHATVAEHLAVLDRAEHDLYLSLADEAARLAGRPRYRDRHRDR